ANFAWIRTADDTRSLASVRSVLASGDLQLSPLNDRRVLISDLHREPLYMDLIGILSLGATTALLLALIGNFIASWLSARGRIANFAILRALGAAPRQVASVLTWEQAIIYSTSIVLGVLFGAFLSLNVVPSLLYTSPPNTDFTSQEFFLLQNIPPIQIIVPVLSGLALAAIVGICIVALGLMVRVVSRPALSLVLRLNED
ncbi:MAG: FtsX-like permease family protein, partial [Ktedonobacteraceae bacterium]|nr:FtsX-like permease family protein [Ktedonobacteraceae bacterium]